jgi:hypothetical protein
MYLCYVNFYKKFHFNKKLTKKDFAIQKALTTITTLKTQIYDANQPV